MIPGSKDDIPGWVQTVRSELKTGISDAVLRTYLHGPMSNALAYEKIVGAKADLTAVQRLLLSVESHLAQPDPTTQYDIFRAARTIPTLRTLARILPRARERVENSAKRLKALRNAKSYDEFDATMFELAVAVAALDNGRVTSARLLDPPGPDLEIHQGGEPPIVVECKKFDRMSDVSVKMREAVRSMRHVLRNELTLMVCQPLNERPLRW